MIDVAALRSLITLESAGTVAATAELLGYTPSAVSQQLRRLERDLGATLTERVGRGLVLTPQGRLTAQRARGLVAELERFRTDVGGAYGVTGEMRLATFSTAERGIVGPATRLLRESAPGLDLHVVEHDPPQAALALERGEVDLAVLHSWVGMPAPLPREVVTQTVGVDVADAVLPDDHPLAGAQSLTPGDLADETWACVHSGSICHAWLLQMFSGLDRAPRIRYWSSEFESQIAYALAGSAVALVPRLGRRALPDGVVAVPVVDPTPQRPVVLAWRSSRADDPGVQRLRDVLAECAARVLR